MDCRVGCDEQRSHYISLDPLSGQVVCAVGYSDLAAFNVFFRNHTGRSPGDWRENCLWIT